MAARGVQQRVLGYGAHHDAGPGSAASDTGAMDLDDMQRFGSGAHLMAPEPGIANGHHQNRSPHAGPAAGARLLGVGGGHDHQQGGYGVGTAVNHGDTDVATHAPTSASRGPEGVLSSSYSALLADTFGDPLFAFAREGSELSFPISPESLAGGGGGGGGADALNASHLLGSAGGFGAAVAAASSSPAGGAGGAMAAPPPKPPPVPPFLLKTMEMLDTPALVPYVAWSGPGDTLVVKKVPSFAADVLPMVRAPGSAGDWLYRTRHCQQAWASSLPHSRPAPPTFAVFQTQQLQQLRATAAHLRFSQGSGRWPGLP
jgi:hypothetical protein